MPADCSLWFLVVSSWEIFSLLLLLCNESQGCSSWVDKIWHPAEPEKPPLWSELSSFSAIKLSYPLATAFQTSFPRFPLSIYWHGREREKFLVDQSSLKAEFCHIRIQPKVTCTFSYIKTDSSPQLRGLDWQITDYTNRETVFYLVIWNWKQIILQGNYTWCDIYTFHWLSCNKTTYPLARLRNVIKLKQEIVCFQLGTLPFISSGNYLIVLHQQIEILRNSIQKEKNASKK